MEKSPLNKYQPISFEQQLLKIFIISVISLTLLTSLLTAWQTSQTLRKNTIDTGEQVTSNFSEQIILALLTASPENGQEAIDRALGFDSVNNVMVFTLEGELLMSSSPLKGNKLASFDHEALTKKQLKESSNTWFFSAPVILKDESFDESLVDPNEEDTEQQTLGVVTVEYDKQALREIQQSIVVSNLVIGSIVALILSIVIRVVLKRLTKPLLALTQTMEKANFSGHYPKAEEQGALEVRFIAQSYNQLMTTLEIQNNALAKSHDTLESEVEIRTQELVVARDSALTASRHKSEFLANISHELRTPLQAIIGYTDLVREELELECMDAQVEDLNKTIRSAHNLLALINNILNLSKIEAGRMDLYLKPVNVRNLIDETIETVLPMSNANGNELKVELGQLSSIMLLDRQKIMQIFLNLLSNASKFTKNGLITFAIQNDANFLYFSVQDTGVGIEQDKIDFIFEKFTQVDGSQARKFEGTGLGMAITQNFCQLMGGSLNVESELSKGSLFSVKLPMPEEA